MSKFKDELQIEVLKNQTDLGHLDINAKDQTIEQLEQQQLTVKEAIEKLKK